MDYLTRKQVLKSNEDGKKKGTRRVRSSFDLLCNSIYSKLNVDEQVEIGEKFLTNEIRAVMKDTDLIECINALFENDLNISETSRNAYLHRNTLLYRIEKVHKITGLNIRKFDDAITFKLLLVIYQKHEKKLGKK